MTDSRNRKEKHFSNEMNDDRAIEQEKMRKFDEIKGTIRLFEAIIEVIILALIYYTVWVWFYRSIPSMPPFYGYGKYVLMGVYAALSVVVFYLCDSFKYGYLKLSDMIVSQWISIVIVNFVTYFQLCLIANVMIHFTPMVGLTIIDFTACFVLVYIFTAFYHQKYVRNMVMIFGNENAINLKFKMDTRSDKYRITDIININAGKKEIVECIMKHDAVIINDVPAQIRNDIMKFCYERGIRTYIVPKITDIISRGSKEITLFDTPLLLVKGRGLNKGQRIIKRVLDIVLCLIAMIPATPIMLLIALAIKIEDRGPVFYRQRRVTINQREFNILKFRSMIVDAEKEGFSIPATGKDPRITRVGHVIRACRLDELPQILNILKGDMSIVGPRPERVEHVKKYCEEIPEFVYRYKVQGGLTGYAQIYGKYNTSAYDKLRLDLIYIENYSVFLDLKLIFMTLQILVRPESTEGFEKVEELERRKQELLSSSATEHNNNNNKPITEKKRL